MPFPPRPHLKEEFVLVTSKWKLAFDGPKSREAALCAAVAGDAVQGACVDGCYSTVLLDSRINQPE